MAPQRPRMSAFAAIGSDLRDAVRMLVKRPLFLATTVLSIAIGAGLNVGIFAVLHHMMFDNPMTAPTPAWPVPSTRSTSWLANVACARSIFAPRSSTTSPAM